jgi:EAL domain-containing protein (putative c-di-GMP-specific phosphodiesterase class I)
MSQADPRVVVVDDVELNVVLLQRMLASFGITAVAGTSDPRQAVELVRSFGADLVLLDLHMPGMSGLDVLAALRAALPEGDYLPVIVLTADESREAREAALRGGAHDFVSKPFDGAEVELRVGNVLRTRWLYQRLEQHTAGLQEQVRRQQEQEQELAAQRQESIDRVRAVLDGSALRMHFQPIVGLADGRLLGVEALARFEVEPRRTPDVWFAEAAAVGLGVELEQAAVAAALAQLPALPSACYLSVNLSAEAVLAPGTLELLTAVAPERIVVELTEHSQVRDYAALTQGLAAQRAAGVRLAVDDTGAGFASLRHILQLHPDVIKLDLALTRDVDTDPVRRALAAALVTFADEIGARVVAEGVETAGELAVLRDLRVDAAQGYYLGRPQPLSLDEVRVAAVTCPAQYQGTAVPASRCVTAFSP